MAIFMSSLFKNKKVVLREERNQRGYRFLSAEIKGNGDLVFEGQDIGGDVEGAFGSREYEWYWTVKELDIPKFKKAIGGDDEILVLLKNSFTNDKAAGLYAFMQENEIPFESYSRCLLYTSPSPRDQRGSRMPSSA